MEERAPSASGWFEGRDAADASTLVAVIRDGSAADPEDWPAAAVDAGFAVDEAAYYGRLRETALRATRDAVEERERAGDQQLIHAVRAMDDMARILV